MIRHVSHLGLLVGLALLAVPADAFAAASVNGRWLTEDGKAIVTIEPCGATVCGRIVRILAPTPNGPPVDSNNPDRTLRQRRILGLEVLSGFVDKGKDWRGRIYSPEEGRTYRSILARNANGTLDVRGCIAFFCKSQTWKPVR